jgi:hypothetical protein
MRPSRTTVMLATGAAVLGFAAGAVGIAGAQTSDSSTTTNPSTETTVPADNGDSNSNSDATKPGCPLDENGNPVRPGAGAGSGRSDTTPSTQEATTNADPTT